MRVLVVEDDFTSRKILQKILGPYGEVDIAVNGLEAVEAFTQSLNDAKPYDLVCMDIMMPEMDGQTALKRIRALEKERGVAPSGEAKVTLFGTGTELALALKAAETLEAEGVATRVVSVPCFELFEQQDAAYQAAIIGRGTVRVAVEAAIKQGWERFIGEDGGFVGMTGFGASAPAEVLYEKFGVTAEAVVAAATARL